MLHDNSEATRCCIHEMLGSSNREISCCISVFEHASRDRGALGAFRTKRIGGNTRALFIFINKCTFRRGACSSGAESSGTMIRASLRALRSRVNALRVAILTRLRGRAENPEINSNPRGCAHNKFRD
jgi:hypothetical protein